MSSAQFHKSVIAIRTGGCLSEAEQHSIFPFFNPFFFLYSALHTMGQWCLLGSCMRDIKPLTAQMSSFFC